MTGHGQCKQPIRLTPRELEVLRLLAEGCTYSQMAGRLGLSAHTVTTHVKNMYRKLDVHSSPAAVMRAVELRFFRDANDSPAADALLGAT